MALRITDLKVDVASLGGDFILTDIRPYYEYKDGERTTNLLGYNYSCALPKLKFEKINIKVEQKKPLIDIEEVQIGTNTLVTFKGLTVGSYFMKGNIHIKANAESIHIREDKTNAVKA